VQVTANERSSLGRTLRGSSSGPVNRLPLGDEA
jgi:hypothetical protein